ncbi:hypothetical protein [Microbulbifer sediminum]|uniref:hypothetical protein n=1 Tax=Microbulbifer sediminum TaxID=2904250 RepID=UPI001F4471A0|nr:hypothetical protein [Microbulbifer sediminum]
MKVIELALLISVVFPFLANACEPILPKVVPPLTPDGDFLYIQPESQKERFIRMVKEVDNRAIVEVSVDYHYNRYPHNAQTEFRVLYGWGEPQPQVVTVIRYETSCGKPKPLKTKLKYVALFESYRSPMLIPYSEVSEHIKALGEPAYVYTSVGLLPR